MSIQPNLRHRTTTNYSSASPINTHIIPQHNTMSAPNAGRQSPEPERQAGSQGNDPLASNVNDQGGESKSNEASSDTLKNLESNPKHILDDASKEKNKKGSA
ncbi:hypothetical protein AMS68_000625 [Peltaster fructicola]|uniref:Uncharacterized protein n=1 Tax=Peltaster fructicola TaxID=286661 RepID=A0A6H0XKE7_9PEZI|nr:hypothetical protein AMS68_000625 [Peltaster fructicola]